MSQGRLCGHGWTAAEQPLLQRSTALYCVSPHGLMRLCNQHDMNIFRLETSFCWGLVCQLCPSSLSFRDLQGNSWWYSAKMTSHAFSARYTMSRVDTLQKLVFRAVDSLLWVLMLLPICVLMLTSLEYIHVMTMLLCTMCLCVCFSNGTPALWTF